MRGTSLLIMLIFKISIYVMMGCISMSMAANILSRIYYVVLTVLTLIYAILIFGMNIQVMVAIVYFDGIESAMLVV